MALMCSLCVSVWLFVLGKELQGFSHTLALSELFHERTAWLVSMVSTPGARSRVKSLTHERRTAAPKMLLFFPADPFLSYQRSFSFPPETC